MADRDDATMSAGRRFAINLAGLVGLVWGLGAIACYVLGYDSFFPTRPYQWLELSGAARFAPPLLVLVASFALVWVLERRPRR